MTVTTRQWIHARAPVHNTLTPECFALREIALPALQAEEALVRVKLLNVHANTRMRMVTNNIPVGGTGEGNYACAEVVESLAPSLPVGSLIACQTGWQEYQIISAAAGAIGHGHASELVKDLNGTRSPWTYVFRPSLVRMWSPEVLMEMLGTSGMTAYFGVRECGPLMPRDQVAVAAVSGSVGSILAQLAKAAGSYVVGFAGGRERCQWVVETLGIDRCLDYRAPEFLTQLEASFPTGIDFYSDGVGGSLTEQVVQKINVNGRLFSYGAAGAFYADELAAPPQPLNMRRFFGISPEVEGILRRRNIKTELWMVDSFYHERLRAEEELSRLLTAGKVRPVHHGVHGFEKLPEAIIGLYNNPRAGKLQVSF